MNVPLLDLKPQYNQIRAEVEPVLREICESQIFILGPKVTECEAAVAAYCGAAHGVGMSSGSDALLVALMAEGIGPGDEVITTPYTFFATVGAIVRVGARPVFVDIDAETYNLDATKLAAAITPRTKAIMPVHLYGQMADMDAIMAVARAKGLIVIEDACQAIGAEWNGKRAGSIGDYGCFRFSLPRISARLAMAGCLRCKMMPRRIRPEFCGIMARSRSITTISWAAISGWMPCRRP